jgi:hypothetical protein
MLVNLAIFTFDTFITGETPGEVSPKSRNDQKVTALGLQSIQRRSIVVRHFAWKMEMIRQGFCRDSEEEFFKMTHSCSVPRKPDRAAQFQSD